jgi:hypothetical protein
MAIDISNLIPKMLGAAQKVLVASWDEAKDYAETEFKKFSISLEDIGKLYAEGRISEQRAKLHIEFQKNAMQTVLLTIEGLGIIAVQNAINAAIDVVKDTVNRAIGFTLL